MGELIGYARVSTHGQSLEAQQRALRELKCVRIFSDKKSGVTSERPQLVAMLDYIRIGDTVVVTRLDRLARSMKELLILLDAMAEKGAGFRSQAEPWCDTTTAAGRLLVTVFGGLAEFERSLIVERTAAGRKIAEENGVRFGRPPILKREQREEIRRMVLQEGHPVSRVARLFNVSRSTIYRDLADSEN